MAFSGLARSVFAVANSVLKKEIQVDLQSKFCFEKGNAN